MVKSAKSHLDEEDEADDYDSSSYKGNTYMCVCIYTHKYVDTFNFIYYYYLFVNLVVDEGEGVKIDGKSSEQKANTHRSKHSETEQRRRSKINERQA